MEQYRPAEQGRCRLGGTGTTAGKAAKVTLDYKAPVAAVIMVLMVAMMVFDFIPVAPVTAVMIAGILMVLTGCFRNVEAAYKTINWESIVLIAVCCLCRWHWKRQGLPNTFRTVWSVNWEHTDRWR